MLEDALYAPYSQPAFVALRSSSHSAPLQALSPHLMSWVEGESGVWIFDITSTLRYWRVKALTSGIGLAQLLERVLQEAFGNRIRAVLAPHPWRAAVMLSFMDERHLSGLVDITEPFGIKLYQDVSWDAWFDNLAPLEEHCEESRSRRYKLAQLSIERSQMERAVLRLGLKRPFDLTHAPISSIKRRFGILIADAWVWAYHNMNTELLGGGSDDPPFPWIPFDIPVKPQSQRHLDYPVWLWEHIEPLLKDDVNGLSIAKDPTLKVSRLEWLLTLHDMTPLSIPVVFRNPHSIISDAPEQKTLLLQAHYSFMNAMQEKGRVQGELGLPTEVPIVSWKLTVEEYFFDAITNSTQTSGKTAEEDLLALENQLPLPLERYPLEQVLLPEKTTHTKTFLSPEAFFAQWIEAAKDRPLFILRRPSPLDENEKQKFTRCHFLERTKLKWWKKKPGTPLYRDYYLATNPDSKRFWIFRNLNDNQWFKHGIYS